MKHLRVAIVGTPRSGSSYLASVLEHLGVKSLSLESPIAMSASQFNPDGYFEDVLFNLLNDQLIRYKFGSQFSFLHPPDIEVSTENIGQSNWEYDLDQQRVEIPLDFEAYLETYCGHTWDVWGISRMREGGKWHKAYSRLGLSNGESLFLTLKEVRRKMETTPSFYVKDARLIFVIEFFHDLFTHIIFLTREDVGLRNSIKRHYGYRLFEGPNFEPYEWVSNHFNYKIPFASFSNFKELYAKAFEISGAYSKTKYVTLSEIDSKSKALKWLTSNKVTL